MYIPRILISILTITKYKLQFACDFYMYEISQPIVQNNGSYNKMETGPMVISFDEHSQGVLRACREGVLAEERWTIYRCCPFLT